MFGFQGGESADIVARKRSYMTGARQRWNCLTNFDLSGIKNADQLATMIKIRLSLPDAKAIAEVEEWMADKQF